MSAATKHSPSTLNLRLSPLRKLAREMADNGLLGPGTASAIERTRGEAAGRGAGNWLLREQRFRSLAKVIGRSLRIRCNSFIFSLLRAPSFDG